MKENEYIICGYRFNDNEEYHKAQQELESINYIRKNTEISNQKNALKLYHKLIERNAFQTVVGYEFLKELRAIILTGGFMGEGKLSPIPIQNVMIEEDLDLSMIQSKKVIEVNRDKLQDYMISLRNAKIIIGFCVAIIIGMFLITFYSERREVEATEAFKEAEVSQQFTIPT